MAQIVPTWLPAGKVGRADITPVAWFAYSFDALVTKYAARPSQDRDGGGAGPVRFFFLKIGRTGVAEFSAWERRPGLVELSLPVTARGVVFWEDFETAMIDLEVPLEEVHRQGAFSWKRRKPVVAGSP